MTCNSIYHVLQGLQSASLEKRPFVSKPKTLEDIRFDLAVTMATCLAKVTMEKLILFRRHPQTSDRILARYIPPHGSPRRFFHTTPDIKQNRLTNNESRKRKWQKKPVDADVIDWLGCVNEGKYWRQKKKCMTLSKLKGSWEWIIYRPNGEVFWDPGGLNRKTHPLFYQHSPSWLRHSDVHFSNIFVVVVVVLYNECTDRLSHHFFWKNSIFNNAKKHKKIHFTITSLLLWKSTFDINKNVWSS